MTEDRKTKLKRAERGRAEQGLILSSVNRPLSSAKKARRRKRLALLLAGYALAQEQEAS